MNIVEISVPDLNDSFSSVVLDGIQYLIRFTWNDTARRWSFGLFTIQKIPLTQGIKIVPRFPLNLQIVDDNFPSGVFGVYSEAETIGRDDFLTGRAVFAYIPAKQGASQ